MAATLRWNSTLRLINLEIYADRLFAFLICHKLFTLLILGDFPHFLSALPFNNQFIIQLVKIWPGRAPHVVVGTLKITLDRLNCVIFYLNLLYTTLLHHGSTSLYITIQWFYFTLLYITLHGSTSLYSTLLYMALLHFTLLYMALLHSTLIYITLLWFYFTPLYYIILPWFYFTLLSSTLLYHGSTSFYFALHYSTIALLHSTLLYNTLPWLYFTLLYSTLPYSYSL